MYIFLKKSQNNICMHSLTQRVKVESFSNIEYWQILELTSNKSKYRKKKMVHSEKLQWKKCPLCPWCNVIRRALSVLLYSPKLITWVCEGRKHPRIQPQTTIQNAWPLLFTAERIIWKRLRLWRGPEEIAKVSNTGQMQFSRWESESEKSARKMQLAWEWRQHRRQQKHPGYDLCFNKWTRTQQVTSGAWVTAMQTALSALSHFQ